MNKQGEEAKKSRDLMRETNAALARGESAEALALLQEAWEADPHNEEIPLLAATLQLTGGEPVRAAHLAVDSLSVRPFQPSAMDVLGVACSDALQPDLARKILRRALRAAPGMENLKRNLDGAKERAKEIRQAAIPEKELLTARHLLPQARIRRLLEPGPPTLTACIVLRDGEESGLDACIESWLPVASTILVADARHDAPELRLPVADDREIASFPVAEPAPAAHNEALRRSRSDWVFIVETGERLRADSIENLTRTMKLEGALAHAVEVRSERGPARLTLRLVRNAPGVRFAGRLDPCVDASLVPLCASWGLTVGDQPVAMLQRGGASAAIEEPGDSQETLRRLERDLSLDPGDHRAGLERARLLVDAGQADEALRVARRVRKTLAADPRNGTPRQLEEPVVLEGRALLRLGRFDELDALITEYRSNHPDSADTLHLAGSVARERNDVAAAVELFRRAVDGDPAPGWSLPSREAAGAGLPNLLGLALIDVGEFDAARKAFDTALERDPDNIEAELGHLAARFGEGMLEEVLTELDRLVQVYGDDPKVWITGGIVLGQVPQLAPAAVEWLEEAGRRFPAHVDLCRRLGEAQLRCGRGSNALDTWNRLDLSGPDLLASRIAAALASGRAIPPVEVDEDDDVGREVLLWFQRWAACGAWETLDHALLDIERAERSLPGFAEGTALWLERGGQKEAADNVRSRCATVSES